MNLTIIFIYRVDPKYGMAIEIKGVRRIDLDKEDRVRMARDPHTPSEVMNVLAEDEDEEVRLEVARNPNAPSNVLRKLARDESRKVRWAVAENLNTPPEALEELAMDEEILWSVARNPNTPIKLLMGLRGRHDVNISLARNPFTCIWSVWNEEKDVREAIAENLLIFGKIEQFKRNISTERKSLQNKRKRGGKIKNKLINILGESTNVEISGGSDIPITLEELVKEMVILIKEGEVWDTLIKMMETLIKGETEIKMLIAKNPSAPAEILRILAEDRDVSIR
ncbi:MAG: hypothetical protein QXT84_02725, partial [Candidatus Bathyarchaeia archaeon]